MTRDLFYIAAGYLSGSILFAYLFGMLLKHKDVAKESRDKNPGTANAFCYGGFLCGLLTLAGDLMKGFLPVHLYIKGAPLVSYGISLAFVLAAPVLGHVFPVFFRFRGGKGIAVSFGCLLGLFPEIGPVCVLAFTFVFYSVILRITPHYHRTCLTYLSAAVIIRFFVKYQYVRLGFLIIALLIQLRMLLSTEEKEKCRARLLWL